MATTRKTTARKSASTTTEKEVAIVEEISTEKVETPVKKVFKDNDPIRCTSVTSGKLIMIGLKTQQRYVWLDTGDYLDVDYTDVIAAVRTRSPYIMKPRFVVDDEDFIKQNKDLQKLYDSLYSKDDLTKILQLPADKMAEVIKKLPDGVQETIKSIAVTAIENGSLDSIQRVKVIDEIFGTQMLIKMTS